MLLYGFQGQTVLGQDTLCAFFVYIHDRLCRCSYINSLMENFDAKAKKFFIIYTSLYTVYVLSTPCLDYIMLRERERMHTHRVFDARLIRDQKFCWTFFLLFAPPSFKNSPNFSLFTSSLEENIYFFLTPQKDYLSWQPRFDELPIWYTFTEYSCRFKFFKHIALMAC